MALSILVLLIIAVVGSAGMSAVLFWIANRINRIEGRGPEEVRHLVAETEELQEQVMLLQSEVQRLTERVDFTEKLLEGPSPEDPVGDGETSGAV